MYIFRYPLWVGDCFFLDAQLEILRLNFQEHVS